MAQVDLTFPAPTAPAVRVGCDCAPGSDGVGPEAARAVAQTFKALGDPTRLHLLAIVGAHHGGEACVCDLTGPVGLAQATVSHHLKILVDAGFLTREQRGRWAYYALVPGALAHVAEQLAQVVPAEVPGDRLGAAPA
ncbi:ArsR/SmtB family transcription factor [Luteimicrobium sp. DT211]|uniref:ArsR/SmtB family transcription factor n=1 Tax=Luteimicrobium sp. DT211 TaxID=3393412 RepID=UPI003CE9726F